MCGDGIVVWLAENATDLNSNQQRAEVLRIDNIGEIHVVLCGCRKARTVDASQIRGVGLPNGLVFRWREAKMFFEGRGE